MNVRLPDMKHQRRHFELTKNKRYYGNVADMGTGKSKMFIDVGAYLFINKKIDAWLIIGNSGSYDTWVTEHLPTHVPHEVMYDVALWSSKLSGKKLAKFEKFIKKCGNFQRLLIVVANVESLSWPRSFNILYNFAKNHRTLTVIDESSTIRNHKSRRTQSAFKLRDVSTGRRFLTGSPIDNKPLDIWAQLEFLSAGLSGYRSYYAFKNQFADMQPIYVSLSPRQRAVNFARLKSLESRILRAMDDVGRNLYRQIITHMHNYNFKLLRSLVGDISRHVNDKYLIDQLYILCLGRVQKIIGYQNLSEFKKIINDTCFVVRSEDCLDLPEKRYLTYKVELTTEQKKIYDDLREESIAYLDEQSVVTVKMVLTRMLRLHQVVCGFIKDDDGVEHEIKNNRLAALVDVTREFAGSGLIFANFKRNISDISEVMSVEYGQDTVRTYYGETSRDHRRQTIDDVHAGLVKWFITNSTGAFGLNLTQLDAMFFFSNIFDAEIRNQVEKRLHRIGREKHRSVLYVDLVTPGTVDEKIINTIKSKRELSESLIISNWRDLI
jgi:SNF2 family DNA or RNA helicase